MKFQSVLLTLIVFGVAWGFLDYFNSLKIQFYYIAGIVTVLIFIVDNLSNDAKGEKDDGK